MKSKQGTRVQEPGLQEFKGRPGDQGGACVDDRPQGHDPCRRVVEGQGRVQHRGGGHATDAGQGGGGEVEPGEKRGGNFS